MKQAENLIIALVLALLSGYWFKMTMDLPQTATTTLYGPRFFPQLILGGLAFCIVLFLWKGFRQLKLNQQTNVEINPFVKGKVIILLVMIVMYIFLFEWIGFCFASIVYIISAQLLFGIRSRITLFLVSPCVIIALNMLFVVVFKIPVP